MRAIPQKELRDNVGAVLREAEAGEEFTVTVAGRAVARLGPLAGPRWVSGAALRVVWDTPAPETLAADLDRLPAGTEDA